MNWRHLPQAKWLVVPTAVLVSWASYSGESSRGWRWNLLFAAAGRSSLVWHRVSGVGAVLPVDLEC